MFTPLNSVHENGPFILVTISVNFKTAYDMLIVGVLQCKKIVPHQF